MSNGRAGREAQYLSGLCAFLAGLKEQCAAALHLHDLLAVQAELPPVERPHAHGHLDGHPRRSARSGPRDEAVSCVCGWKEREGEGGVERVCVHVCVYVYVCMYVCVCVCDCVYVFAKRRGERIREKEKVCAE